MFQLAELFSVFARPHAYLDPGTGSIITQVVVASLLGAGVLLKAFWNKIFKKKTPPAEPETPEPGESETPKSDEQ